MSRLIKTIIAASLAVAVQSGEARSAVQLYKDGPYWSDVNIGAEEPWEFGDYFWWGDTVGYRYDGDAWVATDGTSSSIQFTIDETSLQTYGKDVDALLREGWVTADGVLAPEPDATAQAAVRLGTNGCFQVWAGEKLGVESGGVGELGWVDVEAEGVVPVSGAEYSLRTTFDYSANTFSVAIKNNDVWLPLTSSTPNSNFPLATATTGTQPRVRSGSS